MRDISCLQGPEELENLKKYALNSLDNQEKTFIKKMDKKAKAYVEEESSDFLTLNEITQLDRVWKKYQHLRPFGFLFDPEKKMPKVFKNQTAFIVWTVWRAFHLLSEEDLKGAALAAADVLSRFQSPYLPEAKKEAVKAFSTVMLNTGYSCPEDLLISFWQEKIFPFLEGKWEFKWELKS
ncbi:MAG: hypothetical protein NTU58_02680 [Candidatus Nealsonbacteria bacterium]|nr:hypothetical protein [Candidatus Nealsonbacteria bacterium]